MPRDNPLLASLLEEVRVLPKLVAKTEANISHPQKRQFNYQVRKIVGDCVEQIGDRVTDFNLGRAFKLKRKITSKSALGESSELASRHLLQLLDLIEQHIGRKSEGMFETKVTSIVSQCIGALTAQVDKLGLKSDEELKTDWHTLNRDIEALLRQLEILNPSDERQFEASIWWLGEKGHNKDLDTLFTLKQHPPINSTRSLQAIDKAQQRIIKRENSDLLSFFSLEADDLGHIIDATIKHVDSLPSRYLKRAFNVQRPTQVILALRNIKERLDEKLNSSRIKKWLSTPISVFDEKTPRQALLEGKTSALLHLVNRFDEGPHY